MKPRQEKHHIVDILFVLGLFGVFTLSALVLVTLGANIYKNTMREMKSNYNSRSAYSYIAEKVRQNDVLGNVTIENFYDTDALVFTQEVNDDLYCTYLYFHDGMLKELFMKKDSDIGASPLDAGNDILSLSAFDLSFVSSNILKMHLTTSTGEQKNIILTLRTN